MDADDSLATTNPGPLVVSGVVVPQPDQHLLYDENGRMVRDGCFSYAYDGLDRLTATAIAVPVPPATATLGCGTDTVAYRYDGLDRQTRRVVTPVTGVLLGGARTTALYSDGLGTEPPRVPVAFPQVGHTGRWSG